MSLIAELEADIEAAEEKIKSWFSTIDSDAKALTAHLWSDVKAGLTKAGTAITAEVMAALPGFLSQLKSYASTAVASVAGAFGNDLPEWLAGQLKLSTAMNDLFTVVKSGGITFLGVALELGETTVKTLIQAAASAALAGL